MGPRSALWLLTTINLLNYVDRWLISAVIPRMQDDLHLSNTQAGFIMSAFMLGYFITSPLFGYLTDRVNRIRLVFVGTAAWSVATVVSGLGRTAGQIFSSRMVVGVGEASTVSAGQAVILDLFPRGKRNEAMAIFNAAIPVGAALGFILGGILEQHYGWRGAFFVAGVPGFLVALMLFFVRDPLRGGLDEVIRRTSHDRASAGCDPADRAPADRVRAAGFWADARKLFRNPLYMRTVLGYAAFTFTVGGFASWAPKYLVSVQNVPLKEADTVFGALTVVTGVVGSILGGYGSGYFSRRWKKGDLWFIIIGTLMSIPFTFAGFVLHSKAGFYTCIGLAEFFLFLIQPPINVAIMESVSPFLRGMATAMSVFLIHALGDLISPPLVGWLADRTSLDAAVLVLPSALLLALFFFGDGLRQATER